MIFENGGLLVKTRLLIASVFAFSTFAVPQEVKHAPTLQSCAADLNLWTSQIPGWPTSRTEQDQEATKSLTVHEMKSRISSIAECVGAYPVLNKARPDELSAVLSLTLIYDQQIKARLFDFLERHGLSDKFTEEDEAGKR
jgi:hypothetical protein